MSSTTQNEPIKVEARKFDTGATRDQDFTKPDYEGFLSPLVIERFGEYMHAHRKQADGVLRDSDNWQKGIPLAAYMKSGFRHFQDWWSQHRGLAGKDLLEDALCALLFNVSGYLHETLKARGYRQKMETTVIFGNVSNAPAPLSCTCPTCAAYNRSKNLNAS